jgi:hypothetical protein
MPAFASTCRTPVVAAAAASPAASPPPSAAPSALAPSASALLRIMATLVTRAWFCLTARAGQPPFWAVKRPARTYKSAIQNGF